jgi:uncharacterized lipoprotein YmbA
MSRACIVLALLAACGSAPLPQEHYYRLALPAPPRASQPLAGVLRVERPQVAATLASDMLMVADGDVTLRPYLFHRWAAPLEAHLADELVTWFSRSGWFAHVKGGMDAGGEDVTLHCRVLELCQTVQPGGWHGRVGLELRLERDGRLVRAVELLRVVPAAEPTTAAVVRALGAGMADALAAGAAALRDGLAGELRLESAPGR